MAAVPVAAVVDEVLADLTGLGIVARVMLDSRVARGGRLRVDYFDRWLLHEACPCPTCPTIALATRIGVLSHEPRLVDTARNLLDVAADLAATNPDQAIQYWRFGVAATELSWTLCVRNYPEPDRLLRAVCVVVPWVESLITDLDAVAVDDEGQMGVLQARLYHLTTWRREVLRVLVQRVLIMRVWIALTPVSLTGMPPWADRLSVLLASPMFSR